MPDSPTPEPTPKRRTVSRPVGLCCFASAAAWLLFAPAILATPGAIVLGLFGLGLCTASECGRCRAPVGPRQRFCATCQSPLRK